MRTFSRSAGAAVLAILALQGCSTNPSVSGGRSIGEFAQALDGKFQSLDARGTGQRIPPGLLLLLKPATEHCSRDAGFATLKVLQDRGDLKLPSYLLCQRGPAPIWALGLTYVDATDTSQKSTAGTPAASLFFESTLRTQLLSADQAEGVLQAERLQEQEQRQSDARLLDRQAALERDRQQRIKDQEAEARRIGVQRSAKKAAFQANLKTGDRFQWTVIGAFDSPFKGLVVRIDGPLAFVQFDTLKMSGQNTRYLPKAELDPID